MLPIVEFLPDIASRLAAGKNLVLQAEPGAGKSTALPLSLLGADWLQGKKILMLEPRRIAAKSIAHYLARQLGESVGQRVGYQIKHERKVSENTALEIVTEGILTRRLQNDPEISSVGLILFDEFHERSLHGDLSLMLALEIQQTIREDLKLLVMSATIDTGLLARYLGGAEIIECPGRVFPVSVEYAGSKPLETPRTPQAIQRPMQREALSQQVVTVLGGVLAQGGVGDTLVFLPGQREITQCLEDSKRQFAGKNEVVFLPLFGGLPMAQQEQALVPDPKGKRRVVFTTNIAETSLTIEGVTCVIDSGLEKVLIYDPVSAMTRLETTHISKASAEQRKGRAGRTQAGVCIRLWDEHKQSTLRAFQGEEILSADLAGFALELCIWGVTDFAKINWLTPPPEAHFLSAKKELRWLGLVCAENNVTPSGLKSVSMGVPPRLAAMLLKAQGPVEQSLACELAALLSERDVFLANNGCDIVARVLAIHRYEINRKAALKEYPLKQSAVEQLRKNINALRKRLQVEQPAKEVPLMHLQDAVGKLLLWAYPDRLAKRRGQKDGRYHLANGRGVFLFDDDPLFGSDWLVVTDCDGQKKEGRIYTAAPVNEATVVEQLSGHFIENETFEYDVKKRKVMGRKVTAYGALTLRVEAIAMVDAETFRRCLAGIIKTHGLEVLNWTPRCEAWLSRAQWLGQKLDTFPSLSAQQLIDRVEDWLLPYLADTQSMEGLQRLSIYELLLGTLSWEEQKILDKEAPATYQTPSQKTVAIFYDPQQGPTVSVQLQEMFGEISSPKIAAGRVAIRFELLSPARRPIQTTSDLGQFWKTSYFEVAKDMRGRYPKHRWPEQPLLEKPGKSIKRR